MSCADKTELLHGMLDDELDLPAILEFEAHLKICASCAAEYEAQRQLRANLRALPVYRAPARLRERIEMGLGLDRKPSRTRKISQVRQWIESWGLAWFATTMAACVALLVIFPREFTPREPEALPQLVDSHVRSLLAGHLTDVPSSDRHTVKPWFLGKVNIAPPVVDLADKGFPLVGGRLDYVNEQVVPVLVYKRRQHVINLIIQRAPESSTTAPHAMPYNGYHVVRWTAGGLSFAAVSDVDAADLQIFCDDYRTAALSTISNEGARGP